MPGLSGFELCRQLKADDRYRNIPVLIISGNVDPETRQQAHQVGAEGVLKKPFRHEELMPAVNQASVMVPRPKRLNRLRWNLKKSSAPHQRLPPRHGPKSRWSTPGHRVPSAGPQRRFQCHAGPRRSHPRCPERRLGRT
ncbi:response regulator [Deinococcus radiophilus]|uniref:response regulator n=1 Tax=Deinococcus radiophilus TaxID=32062 RepID=UPI00360686F5